MIYCSSFKKIGNRFKLSCMDWERIVRYESVYDRRHSERGTVHEGKLQNSISRTKKIIIEYGLCNDWDWFVTLTLSPLKYDRYDLNGFRKDLSQWIRDYNKRKLDDSQIKYLLVPERHSDGAWHMHGLLSGLPSDHLSDFVEGEHPWKLCNSGFKNWSAYEKKFGYISLGEVRNRDACVIYMTKYITKDLMQNNIELNCRSVFNSQGLNRAEYLFKNVILEVEEDFKFDFVHEYCRVKSYNFIGDVSNVGDVTSFDNITMFRDKVVFDDGSIVFDDDKPVFANSELMFGYDDVFDMSVFGDGEVFDMSIFDDFESIYCQQLEIKETL